MDTVEQLVDHPHHFEHELSSAADTTMTVVTSYGLRVLGALVILVVGWIVAGQVRRLLVRAGRRTPHMDITIVAFLASLAKYFIIGFTIIAVLGNFGVQTNSVVAVVGAAGLAIGLALQGTLSHVAAGFMLVIFRPFRLGDSVETAGVAGTVREINLFNTEIITADNVRVIVPNNAVWSGVTKNFSSNSTRRSELEIPIPYGADSAQALEAVSKIVHAEPRVLKDPAPVIGISKFADVNAKLVAQVWTATSDAASVQIALNTAFRDQLGRTGYLTAAVPAPSLSPTPT